MTTLNLHHQDFAHNDFDQQIINIIARIKYFVGIVGAMILFPFVMSFFYFHILLTRIQTIRFYKAIRVEITSNSYDEFYELYQVLKNVISAKKNTLSVFNNWYFAPIRTQISYYLNDLEKLQNKISVALFPTKMTDDQWKESKKTFEKFADDWDDDALDVYNKAYHPSMS